jgi:hypothetical protein
MAGQQRQHHSAEQVALSGGVGAGEGQRAVRHPGVEQAGLFQVVDEERQLAERRDGCGRIPFDVDSTGEGVRYRRTHLNPGLFTLWVSNDGMMFGLHARRFPRFGRLRQSSNCRI